MTDRHTFLYQDFAEPASLEVPSCASWMPEPNQPRKDSWAKKWSIAALTAVTLAYVGEPITPPETVTPDKWYQQLSVPTPPKPGLHASLQQWGNHDTLLTLMGDATELLNYPDFDKLPVTDGPITLQGENAYVGPVPISDLRWGQPFSQPVIAKARFVYPQPAFVQPVTAAAETVTVDKWYRQLNEPPKVERYMVAGGGALLSLEVTNISWHVALSEPLHVKPRLHPAYQPFAVNDADALTRAEQVHVQWLVPLSEPVLPKPGVAWQQETALGQPPLTADLQQNWLVPLNEPPKARKAVAYQQPLAFVGEPGDFTPAETITIDKWFRPLSEPVWQKARLWEALQQAYAASAEPIAVDLQYGWLTPFSEPQATKQAPQQLALAFIENVEAAETITVDKWFRALEEPIRTVLSRPDGFYALGQPPITATLELDWFTPLNEPPKGKQSVAYQQALAFVGEPVPLTGDATELLFYLPLETPPKAAPLRFEYPTLAFQGEPDSFVEPPEVPEGGHWGPDWHEERYWKKYDEEIRRKRREERELRREIRKLVAGEQASPRQAPETIGGSVAPGEARHALQQRPRSILGLKQPGDALDLVALRVQLDTVQTELRTLIDERKAIRQEEENALLAILLMVS